VDDHLVAETARRIAEIRVSPKVRKGIGFFLEKRSRLGLSKNPDRQPRRDRLPRDPHRAPASGSARRIGRGSRKAAREAADEAHRIGPAAAQESYLEHRTRSSRAARASGGAGGAPGLRLSLRERGFRSACLSAGIVFVGPSPEAIAAMGDRPRQSASWRRPACARARATTGEKQDAALLEKEASAFG